mmetsp:Transcript_11861/g.26172  ORF Transcript_11861/g.26172 Transcript_11861/m.26172 type:complete len:732 (-) Transcript_11861:130-2325(-)
MAPASREMRRLSDPRNPLNDSEGDVESQDPPRPVAVGNKGCCSLCISDWPRRCFGKCCPWLVKWLQLLGHEQALEVRDKTHFSLYICAAVSAVCIFIWASDVFSGGCLTRPWVGGSEDGTSLFCLFEACGSIIFFGTLCDCLQMLGNYDNEHRELLEKKKQLMADLYSQVTEALTKAKEVTGKLFALLDKMWEESVTNHVKGYFENTLDALWKGLVENEPGQVQREMNKDLILRLSKLIGQRLNEPHHIAAEQSKLLIEVKWVNDDDEDLSRGRRRRRQSQGCNGVKAIVADIKRFSEESLSNDSMPLFWRYWMSTSRLKHVYRQPSFSLEKAETDQIRTKPGRSFMDPLKRLNDLIDKLCDSQKQQARETEDFGQDMEARPWLGCGRPMWSELEDEPLSSCSCCCRCCMPRLVARLFECLSCCWCCGFCSRPCGCPSALDYPKRFRFLCFWLEIVSRLHERLLNSIILSSLYCFVYVWQDATIFSVGCKHSVVSSQFWSCVWEIIRQNALLLGLFWNIPALVTCIFRVQHLDMIFLIQADIRKLQDISSVVKDFENNIRADADKSEMRQMMEDRALSVLKIIADFRLFCMDRAPTTAHVEGLVQHLLQVDQILGTLSEWSILSAGEREAKRKELQHSAASLKNRNFLPRPDTDSEIVSSTSSAELRRSSVSAPVLPRRSSLPGQDQAQGQTQVPLERPSTPPLGRRGSVTAGGAAGNPQPLLRNVSRATH